MEIIKADAKHVEEIVKLWIEFMDFHENLDSIFARSKDGSRNFKSYLEKEIENEDSYVAVAIRKGLIVGYLLAKKSEKPPVFKKTIYCLISDIAVKEQFRHQGIGMKLLKTCIVWAKEKGIDRIELMVVPSNKIAYSFYEQIGFRDYTHTLQLEI